MWLHKFETSIHIKAVGIMLRIDRELWSTGKAVIMNSSFGALKGLLVMVNIDMYGSSLIKIDAMVLTSTSGQKYF